MKKFGHWIRHIPLNFRPRPCSSQVLTFFIQDLFPCAWPYLCLDGAPVRTVQGSNRSRLTLFKRVKIIEWHSDYLLQTFLGPNNLKLDYYSSRHTGTYSQVPLVSHCLYSHSQPLRGSCPTTSPHDYVGLRAFRHVIGCYTRIEGATHASVTPGLL